MNQAAGAGRTDRQEPRPTGLADLTASETSTLCRRYEDHVRAVQQFAVGRRYSVGASMAGTRAWASPRSTARSKRAGVRGTAPPPAPTRHLARPPPATRRGFADILVAQLKVSRGRRGRAAGVALGIPEDKRFGRLRTSVSPRRASAKGIRRTLGWSGTGFRASSRPGRNGTGDTRGVADGTARVRPPLPSRSPDDLTLRWPVEMIRSGGLPWTCARDLRSRAARVAPSSHGLSKRGGCSGAAWLRTQAERFGQREHLIIVAAVRAEQRPGRARVAGVAASSEFSPWLSVTCDGAQPCARSEAASASSNRTLVRAVWLGANGRALGCGRVLGHTRSIAFCEALSIPLVMFRLLLLFAGEWLRGAIVFNALTSSSGARRWRAAWH